MGDRSSFEKSGMSGPWTPIERRSREELAVELWCFSGLDGARGESSSSGGTGEQASGVPASESVGLPTRVVAIES